MIKTMCLEVFKASSKLCVNVKVGIDLQFLQPLGWIGNLTSHMFKVCLNNGLELNLIKEPFCICRTTLDCTSYSDCILTIICTRK